MKADAIILAGVRERRVEGARRVAAERYGEILQVHGEAWAAMEGCFPRHFSSLGALLLSGCHGRRLREVIYFLSLPSVDLGVFFFEFLKL